MQQLDNLTQERDRLTVNVLALNDQLVAVKREVQYNIVLFIAFSVKTNFCRAR